MHLTINLPDDLAQELESEANRRGVETAQYAVQLIQDNLSAAERARQLKELFDQWDREDATDDPAEIERRQREWEEFKKALEENRGIKRSESRE